MNLKVEVGASGAALIANAGNSLTRGHAVAHSHLELVCRHVAVDGDGAVIMLDADPVAKALCRAGVDDGTVHDRVNRGANRVSYVDAVVRGAPALAKARSKRAGGRKDHGIARGVFAALGGETGVVALWGECFLQTWYRTRVEDDVHAARFVAVYLWRSLAVEQANRGGG